jgi:hypothetical protein
MERKMRKFLFIGMAIILAACSAAATEVPSEFESARQKWQEASISHYRFNLNLSCFCAFAENMPLVLEVQEGEVVSMEYQNGNEIEVTNLEFFQQYATIERIFEQLEKALGGEADEVTVTYDETYGFPTQADIDFVEQAIDDELYLTISDFEVLPE